MLTIFETIGNYAGYILVGLFVLVITLLVLVIILLNKYNKLNQRLSLFLKGRKGEELEEIINERFAELDIMQQVAAKHAKEIKTLKRQFRSSYSKFGLVKYDAFKEMGGTLSFTLALLTDRNDGFILNCVHSREGSYTYVKEIIHGESYIVLSPEEKTALDHAINMKSLVD